MTFQKLLQVMQGLKFLKVLFPITAEEKAPFLYFLALCEMDNTLVIMHRYGVYL